MTHFTIKRCSIRSFDNYFPMVEADILDEDHHKVLHVLEWLKKDGHTDRSNSCIIENDQIDFTDINIKDLFDCLDKGLDDLKNDKPVSSRFSIIMIKLMGLF